MARIAFGATLGQNLGNGIWAVDAARCTPLLDLNTVVDSALGEAQELEAAIIAAQAAAEADATISGNPTALALVEAIETATSAYITQVALAATAANVAVAAAAESHHAVFDIDTTAVDCGCDAQIVLRAISAVIPNSYP